MTYATGIEVEMERARKLVAKDNRQRWVYKDHMGAHISESPIPFKDAVSIYWMPIPGCVGMTFRHAALAHPAIR